MKKRYSFVAVAILAVGLGLAGCDLFEGGNGSIQETYAPLVIEGRDSGGIPVKIIFSTTRIIKAATMIPDNDDRYEIRYNEARASYGAIKVPRQTVIAFRPEDGGNSFTGTLTGENNLILPDITLADGRIIRGFKPGGTGTSGDSSSAKEIADQLGKNAAVEGGNVVITGDIEVTKNIVIPAGVKLIFNTGKSASFKINGSISVTANGGIEVPDGMDVKFTGDGSLIIGEKSTVSGKLDIDRGTLDISASLTIESRGVMSLAAVLKGSGSLIVKYGARLKTPDLLGFNFTGLTGGIEVEAGGEMILVTALSPPHPLIGTAGTLVDELPVGADFVMNFAAYPGSKINVKVVSGIPVLELTGRAVALGLLDLNAMAGSMAPVWLTYQFTVAKDSVLQVGNSEDRYSSLILAGNGNPPGLRAGGLINNGKVLVFKKSGIFEYPGGKFTDNNNVYKHEGADNANLSLIRPESVTINNVSGRMWDGGFWPPKSGQSPLNDPADLEFYR